MPTPVGRLAPKGTTLTTQAPRMLFLGSFPPRECGIATFTKDVVDSYDDEFGTRSTIVAIDEPGGESRRYSDQVVARLTQDDPASYPAIADFVNAYACDALSIQHEYGLFGGEEGEWIVDLIARVRKPVITSLHTVLPEPSASHLRVARALCAVSSAVVVLSETGARHPGRALRRRPGARSGSSTTAFPTCRSSRPRPLSARWASRAGPPSRPSG